MSQLVVYATRQGLYSVCRDGRQVGLISNAGGRWLLHEMDGRTLIGRDPVDVTRVLHRSAELHAALVAYLPAETANRGRLVDLTA